MLLWLTPVCSSGARCTMMVYIRRCSDQSLRLRAVASIIRCDWNSQIAVDWKSCTGVAPDAAVRAKDPARRACTHELHLDGESIVSCWRTPPPQVGVAMDCIDFEIPSGSPWNQHAHSLPGASLSTKSGRQSIEGYAHGSRWISKERERQTRWHRTRCR
jgi:hypothetical protein